MRRALLALLLLVSATAAALILRLLDRAGTFTELVEAPIEGCVRIASPPGSEDLEIDRGTGWVFVSAFDRRTAGGVTAEKGGVRGGIFAAQIDRLGEGFVELTGRDTPGMPELFAPHGIGFFDGPGQKRLAVINHTAAGERVEIFAIGDEGADRHGGRPRLQHLRTVESEHFRSLNDVVMVGPERYYASNDHWYPPGARQTIETYLILDLAEIVYDDGRQVRPVADGLSFGNGIEVSAGGRTLYVAETTDAALRVYDRDLDSGELRLRPGGAGIVAVPHGPDNLDLAADGSLWVANHPKVLEVPAHKQDPKVRAASQVFRMPVGADGSLGPPQTIYANDGSEISSGSVAVQYGRRVLVGQIMEDYLLACPYAEGE